MLSWIGVAANSVESQAVQYGRTVEPSKCLSLRVWRRERVGSLLVMSLRKKRRKYCGQEEVLMGRKEPTKERGSAGAEWMREAWMDCPEYCPLFVYVCRSMFESSL